MFAPEHGVVTKADLVEKGQMDQLLRHEFHDDSTVTYREQGNREMYTEKNLALRRKLFDSARIQNLLALYYCTFESVQKGVKRLERIEVIEVEVKICKALFEPSEWSLDEAVTAVEADWHRLKGEKTHMSRSDFFHSLFETVDLWTESADIEEYVSFLCKLYRRISIPAKLGSSCYSRRWADLNSIDSLGAKPDVTEAGAKNEELEAFDESGWLTSQNVPVAEVPSSIGNDADDDDGGVSEEPKVQPLSRKNTPRMLLHFKRSPRGNEKEGFKKDDAADSPGTATVPNDTRIKERGGSDPNDSLPSTGASSRVVAQSSSSDGGGTGQSAHTGKKHAAELQTPARETTANSERRTGTNDNAASRVAGSKEPFKTGAAQQEGPIAALDWRDKETTKGKDKGGVWYGGGVGSALDGFAGSVHATADSKESAPMDLGKSAALSSSLAASDTADRRGSQSDGKNLEPKPQPPRSKIKSGKERFRRAVKAIGAANSLMRRPRRASLDQLDPGPYEGGHGIATITRGDYSNLTSRRGSIGAERLPAVKGREDTSEETSLSPKGTSTRRPSVPNRARRTPQSIRRTIVGGAPAATAEKQVLSTTTFLPPTTYLGSASVAHQFPRRRSSITGIPVGTLQATKKAKDTVTRASEQLNKKTRPTVVDVGLDLPMGGGGGIKGAAGTAPSAAKQSTTVGTAGPGAEPVSSHEKPRYRRNSVGGHWRSEGKTAGIQMMKEGAAPAATASTSKDGSGEIRGAEGIFHSPRKASRAPAPTGAKRGSFEAVGGVSLELDLRR